MLKKHGQLFQMFLFFADMAVVSVSWVLAYLLRFQLGPVPVLKGIPGSNEFLLLLYILLPLSAVMFRFAGLYEPMRASARLEEIKRVFTALSLVTLSFITLIYLTREEKYSRGVFIYFWVSSVVLLSVFRYFVRLLFNWLRVKGYNLRYVLIVGDGQAAQKVEEKLAEHAEYGFKVVGFLSKDKENVGNKIHGIPVVGTYADTRQMIESLDIDQLILALPFDHIRMLKAILGRVYDEMVEIKVVPDITEYFTLRRSIEELDGLPIINLRESPLYGWNRMLKRLFDILVSLFMLILLGPLMLLIALAIKLASPGPVFYKQKRMGMDGGTFKITKFRSMAVGAEKKTGPVWAKENDERRSSIGSFLRRYNLDELPQLFNVLKGEMSIVGPRPERPEFMQEFKKKMPEYMLRHKMKSGITGWAQVNGLRGNTSIEERTKYDLYYIENWSLFFDMGILVRTIFAFKNAY